jgi:hypothetical protein
MRGALPEALSQLVLPFRYRAVRVLIFTKNWNLNSCVSASEQTGKSNRIKDGESLNLGS